jgi:hypothetical protein
MVSSSAFSSDIDLNESIRITDEVRSISSKISPQLLEVMEKSGENDLIPIYIFRDLIPDRIIDEHITRETGLIPAHYRNRTYFETIIMPEIIRSVEERVSRENAHMVDSESRMSLIDLAAHEAIGNIMK